MGLERGALPGAARLMLADGVALLQPEESVLSAMLEGWGRQQRSRLLGAATVRSRVAMVRRFGGFTGEYPWRWTSGDVEEWTSSLLSGASPLAHSTIRGYHVALRLFCDYTTDARYGWGEECDRRFGVRPVQVCHEWNTAEHLSEFEGRPGNRAFTLEELQALFDVMDAAVEAVRRRGRKGVVAALRDAALFKVAYGWGLRRRECAMLDVADFRRNPHAPQFGRLGALHVRYGKAVKGSPPRRRTVLSVFDWAVEAAAQYLEEIRPLFGFSRHPALWLTERGGRVSVVHLNARFAAYRREAGLPEELGTHCLRHSYVTHLIEAGWDPLFVQQQVGHAYASTTAIYTGVSSAFKNAALRRGLEGLLPACPAGEGVR